LWQSSIFIERPLKFSKGIYLIMTSLRSTVPTGIISPSPLQNVPEHVLAVLARLHSQSSTQEAAISQQDFQDRTFDDVMRDKFIALDQDKAQFIYQLCRAINATTIVEAGTSYGVSTIYLALAAAANAAAATAEGAQARVIATENEPDKAAKAREHWGECGDDVTSVIDLREGDLRETLKTDLGTVDFLLLDSTFSPRFGRGRNTKPGVKADRVTVWTPMALPTLKLVQPRMRHGAVIIADNTISSGDKYKEFFDYIRAPDSGFTNSTLPFSGGLEMSVYLPRGGRPKAGA
jgi:predicted O-methyltransferase YrrM